MDDTLRGKDYIAIDAHNERKTSVEQLLHVAASLFSVGHDVDITLWNQKHLQDHKSTNGTFLNGKRLDAARYYELHPSDLISFGGSSREYVIMSAGSL